MVLNNAVVCSPVLPTLGSFSVVPVQLFLTTLCQELHLQFSSQGTSFEVPSKPFNNKVHFLCLFTIMKNTSFLHLWPLERMQKGQVN